MKSSHCLMRVAPLAVTGLVLLSLGGATAKAQLFKEAKEENKTEAAPASATDFDSPRVFTDARGQAVTGQIQDVVSGGLVAIKTQGGGVMKAKLSDLSLDDQKYVEAWYTAKILSRGRGFSFKAERSEGEPQQTVVLAVTVSVKEVFYKVSIKSQSVLPLTDLTIVHRTYKKAEAAERGSTTARVYEEGKEPVARLEPGQEITVNTAKQKLESSQLDGGYKFVNGNKRKTEDRIGGVWLRIYKGNTVIGEFAEPKALMELETWDAVEKPK